MLLTTNVRQAFARSPTMSIRTAAMQLELICSVEDGYYVL